MGSRVKSSINPKLPFADCPAFAGRHQDVRLDVALRCCSGWGGSRTMMGAHSWSASSTPGCPTPTSRRWWRGSARPWTATSGRCPGPTWSTPASPALQGTATITSASAASQVCGRQLPQHAGHIMLALRAALLLRRLVHLHSLNKASPSSVTSTEGADGQHPFIFLTARNRK